MSNEASDKPSYSTIELARRLGVSTPTIQRWVDQGRLLAWKTIGGHRRIDAQSADALVLEMERQASGAAPSASGPSVLIVEDDAIDREIHKTLVESIWPSAKVTLAENGLEALLAIGKSVPDIVMSDIVMPHMDGLQMLRQLTLLEGARPRLLVAVSALKPAQIHKLGGLPPRVLSIAKPVEPEIAGVALASAWQQVR
ncbi:response regulator [Roseateles violae]|uniref:Response regulator n=1 Tax=Roseateles violae TaxID=3058042 RepID=A0ABT8DV31_9BURK|nr:response regulator [Pelomonas sp. PFR6]MDN3920764.1 response regulator [Pelomonas sp. PFR6]